MTIQINITVAIKWVFPRDIVGISEGYKWCKIDLTM